MTNYIQESNPRLVAAEMFSSAVCNLSCSYCYIPKNQKMVEYHQRIVQALRENTYVSILKDIFGEDLEELGLWGTEQTLILQELEPHIGKFFEAFPKLKGISFSTNFVSHTDRILSFIQKIEETADRPVDFRFQISLDGPFWITDIGRGKGVTKKIKDNVTKLLKDLQNIQAKKVSLTFSFKSTVGIDSIKLLTTGEDKIIQYYKFFQDLDDEINDGLKYIRNIKVTAWGYSPPTLVVPGKYTYEDGKTLEKFYKMLRVINAKNHNNEISELTKKQFSLNEYAYRLDDMLQNINLFMDEPYNVTCSAFDTQAGVDIDGTILPCHRLFLFNDESYVQEMMKNNIEEWDVSRVSTGILKNIQKHFLPKVSNSKEIAKYSYTSRGYHDFHKTKLNYTFNTIKELAAAGQASQIYLEDDDLTFILSLFINTKLSCPAENYINTGTLHLTPISMIRVLANGAFEEVFAEYFEIQERLQKEHGGLSNAG